MKGYTNCSCEIKGFSIPLNQEVKIIGKVKDSWFCSGYAYLIFFKDHQSHKAVMVDIGLINLEETIPLLEV